MMIERTKNIVSMVPFSTTAGSSKGSRYASTRSGQRQLRNGFRRWVPRGIYVNPSHAYCPRSPSSKLPESRCQRASKRYCVFFFFSFIVIDECDHIQLDSYNCNKLFTN